MSDSIFTTTQLHDAGLSRHAIRTLANTGQLTRVAAGWYASSGADPRIVRGLKAGGRIGCLTGCQIYGLWTPPSNGHLHVVYAAGLTPRPQPGITTHRFRSTQPATSVWPLLDCLEHVLHQHSAEEFAVVAESAMNLQLVHLADVRSLRPAAPSRRRTVFNYIQWAESGSETRVRLFLQQRRIRVQAQVKIPGIGRVDLVVGQRLIIECDSETHHSTPESRAEDARRDLAARVLGYETIRLRYAQIWFEWANTSQLLLGIIRQRHHLREPRSMSA